MSLLFVQILSSLFFLLPIYKYGQLLMRTRSSRSFSFLTFSSALLCGASTFFFFLYSTSFDDAVVVVVLLFSPPFFLYKERRWQRSVRSTLILIVDRKDKTGTETWWRTERFT